MARSDRYRSSLSHLTHTPDCLSVWSQFEVALQTFTRYPATNVEVTALSGARVLAAEWLESARLRQSLPNDLNRPISASCRTSHVGSFRFGLDIGWPQCSHLRDTGSMVASGGNGGKAWFASLWTTAGGISGCFTMIWKVALAIAWLFAWRGEDPIEEQYD